ncbi:MFS transporter [Microvirga sp. CF3016]|uniref:MFS transporter n=1 Tax=Microvirga sp. CF3016 TaxID=3110181 RepID=UPI002E78FBCE|nr:MFS transporter [Microvirga sp. CF3016]MEE1613681.1 MFS transporter [Microvirga sp. CF3016]
MTAIVHARPFGVMPWPVVATVVGSGIVAAFQVGKAAIATPLLQTELGLDLAAAGSLTAVFALLGAIGGIPAGAIVAAAGDRRILIIGLLAVSLGSAAGAEAATFLRLLASRVVEGLGFLLITVAGPAILERALVGSRRDLAFGIWSCFMPAGMAIAMLVGPLFGGWRDLWWASAGAAVAAAAATLLLVPGSAARVSLLWRDVALRACSIVSLKGPILLAGCFALYSLMFFALFSFLPVLLMDRMMITHAAAGTLSALVAGVNVIGNLTAGYLLTRGIGRPTLIAQASLVMGASALGIFLPVFDPASALLLCVMFSAVGGIIPATLLSSAPIISPVGLAPITVGLVMQGSNLGQIVGPVAVGSMIEAYGWSAAAGTVLAAASLAILIASALRSELRPNR